jgi:hypothetical protein
MKWLRKIKEWLMSRLAQIRNKMRAEVGQEQKEKNKQSAYEFQEFYKSTYYKKFKAGIEDKLHELDRQPITDPSTLVLIQGQRNALMAILDDLNRRERQANAALREKK